MNFAHRSGLVNLFAATVFVPVTGLIAFCTVMAFQAEMPWAGVAMLALTAFSGYFTGTCLRDGLAERRVLRAEAHQQL